uniref:ABC transporter ATP-binding protein n=1 Tax=Crateriforma conspicua TaxID=2527996 RepID=UPI0018C882B1|nr:ABC transporter ATP-binding protein [Crateriforma conspicua]
MSQTDVPHDRSSPMVVCQGLCKRYGAFDALRACDLTVTAGEVFGLLGPNGAGKTTLIRLMLGYIHPTAGTCRVAGIDVVDDSVAVRRNVSYLPGDARLPRHMRGKGVLEFFAAMHPDGDLQRSLDVAQRLDLNLRTHVAFMSTGMRQKLALAVVLGPRTPLLVLDEPTANLDPTVRAEVLQMVREARADGRTVMLSSHVLSEIEETCGEVAILRRGVLAHRLTMSELFQQHRITGDLDRPVADRLVDPNSDAIPMQFADRLVCSLADDAAGVSGASGSNSSTTVRLDTSGDLASFLGWLDDLGIRRMRVEPLGLRAVYDAVHFGQTIPVGVSTAPHGAMHAAGTSRPSEETVS